MTYLKAFFAVFQGLSYCFGNKEIRRLAMWPWLVGAVCYVLTAIGAWHLHPLLLDWLVSEPGGFFGWVLYALAWIGVAIVLLIASVLVSIVLVIIFTSFFQSAIAAKVLTELGRSPPPQPEGLSGNTQEIIRTMIVETAKLFWLLPLILVAFVFGFVPFLLPIAVLLGAWLLAYQFVDIVLDLYRLPARSRLAFSLRHTMLLTMFGLGLAALWAIPFVGLLLPPAAVAAAAWLLSESQVIVQVEHASGLLPRTPPEPSPGGSVQR